MAGKRYFGGDNDKEESSTEGAEARRFQNVIHEVFELSEASNPQNFLPLLWWIDYGGEADLTEGTRITMLKLKPLEPNISDLRNSEWCEFRPPLEIQSISSFEVWE
ncbi:hypothetical protein BUALT_BualtUnG0059700 [Buddleja alternifolia]|uniref:Uncharacterized protein n=1 Tax=Buddleja alternifolia TaxID=168488 RepID=A0AAV6W2V4_9LAMI|nr:hypothetical protein BUALT_BualtUnG0059700 [Buddleja alternifolia]